MTIYAIVNNLLKTHDNAESGNPIWTVISASAILQGGNPYFVPDFADHYEVRTALALRIGKLGKSIAPRFAHRYIDATAPACVMLASDMLRTLQDKGLPWSSAISYDRSVAIGKFAPCPYDQIGDSNVEMTMISDGKEIIEKLPSSSFSDVIADTISALSRDNALKTGDIILAGINGTGPTLSPGQRIVLSIDRDERLKFNIR